METLLETGLPLMGAALCLLAVIQLSFWSIQSWQLNRESRQQCELGKALLRQQIENAKANRGRQVPTDRNLTVNTGNVSSPASAEEGIVDSSGTWKGFRVFQVARIEAETPLCKSVYLQPVDAKPIASFRAGQHLPLRFSIDGQSVVRCYSLSNGPDQDHYRISVKRVPAASEAHPPGRVSNFVNDSLQVGDRIEVKTPSGSFYSDDSLSIPLVLLGGGIGITPMISTIQEAITKNLSRPIVLFYGVRNRSDQAFRLWLNQVADRHSNIHVVNCFSNPTSDEQLGEDYQVAGYVSIDLLKQVLPGKDCEFLLCGPPPFIDSLTTGLESWGVSQDMIKMEAFGPASRKRPSAPTATVSDAKVSFLKSGKSVEWTGQYESLLELAEEAGIEIESGCRAGACGTCLTRLLHGSVEHDDVVDCEPDECLVCIARPNGDVELEA